MLNSLMSINNASKKSECESRRMFRGRAPLKAQISLQDLPCVDNNTSPSRLRTAGNSTNIFFVHYWQQPENTWIFTDSIAFQELEEEKQTYNCLAQCHTSENKDWWPINEHWNQNSRNVQIFWQISAKPSTPAIGNQEAARYSLCSSCIYV